MTAITMDAQTSSILQFFRRVYKAMINARQRQANREIAKYLHRNEFRQESIDFVENMIEEIEEGRANEILENRKNR